MGLGEARSKCEHISGAPLDPSVAHKLLRVALVKGAQATVAIEGNTLTTDQVQGILDGDYEAPSSREYQQREVTNVLEAFDTIDRQLVEGDAPRITADLIREYNRMVLAGTDLGVDVEPGEVRSHSVAVGNYRGAPAEDCDYLIDRLAEWLESDTFKSEIPEVNFALAVAGAVLAHLYIAWIHPFADGNGRTARLLEFLILARCGKVPMPAAHLLSNHYNLTRDRYYRELGMASETLSIKSMLRYSVEGFVDGLRDQVAEVREHQLIVSWTNLVHEVMRQFPAGEVRDRQRTLVLAMRRSQAYVKSELTDLTPEIARLYAVTGDRTLARDLNRLQSANLVRKVGKRWYSNIEMIEAFLPRTAADPELT
jgi:Fic family protein